MFRLIDDPEFLADVPVPMPGADGSWQVQMLRTRFRLLPRSQIAALEGDRVGEADILDRAVVGFEDVVDAAGQPLEGARARLLEYAHVRLALLRHYAAAQVDARLGNSGPSAAPGPAVN